MEKFYDDLTDAEKDALKERRRRDIDRLYEYDYPLSATFLKTGSPAEILGPAVFFEPYKSAAAKYGKGQRDDQILYRHRGETLLGSAKEFAVRGRPLLAPLPPAGRARGPWAKESRYSERDRPNDVHLYVFSSRDGVEWRYAYPEGFPAMRLAFGRYGGGCRLFHKLDRREASIVQLAVEWIEKNLGYKVHVHYRRPS